MAAEQAIRDVIQTYFDCMFESDPAKARRAFHAGATITGYLQGKLQEMSVESFATFVGSQQPSAQAKGEKPVLDVVSLDVAGDTAVARVRDVYLGLVFLDTLTFLRTNDEWRIHHKLYHVEGAA